MFEISPLWIPCVLLIFGEVSGHGFLRDPPGRSSMWLFGYGTPANYQHMELFCGGFPTQWWLNDGKCGVCGDPYNAPRENEPPYGKYAKGVITQSYTSGSIMRATVHVTASHKGYFEFRLCPHDEPNITVTQECLDRNLLSDPITKGTKFFVDDKSVGIYQLELQLPEGVVCNACVLQWRYRTGNRWGCYNSDFTKGPCGLGFGPQEEFYACSDIRIQGNNTTVITSTRPSPETSVTSLSKTTTILTSSTTAEKVVTTTTANPTTTQKSTTPLITSTPQPVQTTTAPTPTVNIVCKAVGPWKNSLPMDNWCRINCARNYCPPTHCMCGREDLLTVDNGIMNSGKTCVSLRPNSGWDLWCQHNCPMGLCYPSICRCGSLTLSKMVQHNLGTR
ncbi:uncharacterized protein LOC128169067 [Crassostrea angulata]|uniref:uncharacterized protein LOC128169067 n=1 Tax=Magallana angulata TaxID=2784310 RepID=UPI0022B0DA61|nr:uncharacterized protein LOC128169067 [Crassostrea angulata]